MRCGPSRASARPRRAEPRARRIEHHASGAHGERVRERASRRARSSSTRSPCARVAARSATAAGSASTAITRSKRRARPSVKKPAPAKSSTRDVRPGRVVPRRRQRLAQRGVRLDETPGEIRSGPAPPQHDRRRRGRPALARAPPLPAASSHSPSRSGGASRERAQRASSAGDEHRAARRAHAWVAAPEADTAALRGSARARDSRRRRGRVTHRPRHASADPRQRVARIARFAAKLRRVVDVLPGAAAAGPEDGAARRARAGPGSSTSIAAREARVLATTRARTRSPGAVNGTNTTRPSGARADAVAAGCERLDRSSTRSANSTAYLSDLVIFEPWMPSRPSGPSG